jgi:hypothetical protein
MQKTCPILLFAVAILFCGCDKQAKINNEKINLLSQKIVQLEQSQARQMAVIQSELTALAPKMERIDSSYFEKNRDDALFFHTNTLFLLLTVGKQIEAQLQTAAAEREVQNALAFSYHTNQLGTLYLCTAQIEDAMNSQESRIGNALTNQENWIHDEMAEQEKRIEENIIAASRQSSAALNDALSNQIKQVAVPDADETARRAKTEADIAQIQRDLAAIKLRLTATNPPASKFW